MGMPQNVRIVEVGPRDGLQNESGELPVAVKVELVERLAAAGLPAVEAGSFVSPKWVPQMAGSGEVFRRLTKRPSTSYPALVPNIKGLAAAVAAGVEEIAVFVSASEGFSRKNLACSRAESLDRLREVFDLAGARGMKVRGYVSCIAGCPFDGDVAPVEVATMANDLAAMGCYEIALGDTIGVGTAGQIRGVIERVAADLPREAIAMHFHDTYGQGLANVLASLEEGIAVFDSSVAGLGGCPYAPGATGNVATEDVLYLLQGLGISTGVDLSMVAETGAWISGLLGRRNESHAGRALQAGRQTGG
ncbi:MAG: hydroxymethylglutaryl-CoA lyase [Alphaproteobacteria bacterium]|nr:hydroxymethylglutaryl-CoA lyase [Rhizobiaceae bacterium]MBU4051496.1 hydroxymethylglutaryl-CoA lyase [Alphaproteobacteria bacterium]MBU4087911.1 hydroxymethylglutaryl-CoA lyase [Alphaproteobacteria bacterium]MBU4156252.1 hydroxymethylglutaryl-CoA lyase [Alphaproteobacteria bacterium]